MNGAKRQSAPPTGGCAHSLRLHGQALARDTGCKIIPVAHNAGDFWGRRSVIKHPGKIRCVIGPPIDASGREPKETNLIVQDWVETKMLEISEVYRQKAAERRLSAPPGPEASKQA